MPLQTDPTAFSITALLADQVALIARHEGVSPGAAALMLRQLLDGAGGRHRLLRMIEQEWRREANPAEAAKIAAVHRETAAWETAAWAAERAALEPKRTPPVPWRTRVPAANTRRDGRTA